MEKKYKFKEDKKKQCYTCGYLMDDDPAYKCTRGVIRRVLYADSKNDLAVLMAENDCYDYINRQIYNHQQKANPKQDRHKYYSWKERISN